MRRLDALLVVMSMADECVAQQQNSMHGDAGFGSALKGPEFACPFEKFSCWQLLVGSA